MNTLSFNSRNTPLKLLYCFKLIALGMILSSCSGTPTISEFETELKFQIEKESSGSISLLSIEKTTAEEKEFLGQKAYSIYYNATILFNEDCWIYINKSGVGPKFENFKTYSDQPEFLPSLTNVIGYGKKGETTSFSGTATYFETENGWIRK